MSMFLSLEVPAVVAIIAVIVAQYGFATFCLYRLALIDIPRKNYVLWNIFILLVFFVGGIVFLVYYNKVKEEKAIPPYVPPQEEEEPDRPVDPYADAPGDGGTDSPAENSPDTDGTADGA